MNARQSRAVPLAFVNCRPSGLAGRAPTASAVRFKPICTREHSRCSVELLAEQFLLGGSEVSEKRRVSDTECVGNVAGGTAPWSCEVALVVGGLECGELFLASLIVLPSVLVIWDHLIVGERTIAPLFGIGRQPWREDVAVAAAGDEPRLTTSDAVTDQVPSVPDDAADGGQVGPDEDQSSDDDTATGGGGADAGTDDSDESDT
jgi:hypothetical protein